MRRALRFARCVSAVGLVAARWLAAVYNVAALCGWLDVASLLFAAVHAAAFAGSPAACGSPVLGRRGARLLVLDLRVESRERRPRRDWVRAIRVAHGNPRWTGPAGVGLGAPWGAGGCPLGGGSGVPAGAVRPMALRHVALSMVIVLVLGLQAAALFRDRPTLWPFIDYPLYSAAQRTAVRAVHYRLYGVTSHEPPTQVEITAEALGMSWFVYHTDLIPRLFDRPWLVPEQFERALRASDLPPFRRIVSERTTFVLAERGIIEFPERRRVGIELATGDPETAEPEGPVSTPAVRTSPR